MSPRTNSIFVPAVFLLLYMSGCATVRLAKPDVWKPAVHPQQLWVGGDAAHTTPSPATSLERKTVWVLFWGWNQVNVLPTDCTGTGFAEVRVSTNLGYELISVLTIGFVQPITIEWNCAKQAQPAVKDF
jgi:hypothetical protein